MNKMRLDIKLIPTEGSLQLNNNNKNKNKKKN